MTGSCELYWTELLQQTCSKNSGEVRAGALKLCDVTTRLFGSQTPFLSRLCREAHLKCVQPSHNSVLAACWALTNVKNHKFSRVWLTGSLFKSKEEYQKELAVLFSICILKIWQWKQAWDTTSGPKTISESECFINPQRKLLIWFTWQISLDIYHRCRQVSSALCLFEADSLNFHVIGSHSFPLTSCRPSLTDAAPLMLICVPSKFPFPCFHMVFQPVKFSACCSMSLQCCFSQAVCTKHCLVRCW